MNDWDARLGIDSSAVAEVVIDGRRLGEGDRVRIRPRAAADVLDLVLHDRLGTVESTEQDYEGRLYVAVVLDADPGRAIGRRGPAHRFFFDPTEIEYVGPDRDGSSAGRAGTVLVAGIGNVFLGDDGFGVAVAEKLAERQLPDGVIAVDFGIRGYDLAYALADGYEHVVLVDACRRGGEPGTLYVIEPEVSDEALGIDAGPPPLDAHAMNPVSVLRLARALGSPVDHVRVVGCEPATLGPAEGLMALSPEVERAVDEAVVLVERLVRELRDTTRSESGSRTP